MKQNLYIFEYSGYDKAENYFGHERAYVYADNEEDAKELFDNAAKNAFREVSVKRIR